MNSYQWIDVNVTLPEKQCYVLVACVGGSVHTDYYCPDYEFLRNYGDSYSRKRQGKLSRYFRSSHKFGYQITHWMPLPSHPTVSKENI